jgi:hypothetical protein
MDDLPVQPHHKYEKKKPLIGTSVFFNEFCDAAKLSL